jgi:hypothetical protein
MLRYIVCNIIGLLLCASCVTTPRTSSSKAARFSPSSAEKQNIILAVYHFMFTRGTGQNADKSMMFYLSMDWRFVSSELLAGFRAEGYRVLPGSKYREGQGILCSIHKIEWRTPTEVKVTASYTVGSLGHEWGYFLLTKEIGQWKVIVWYPEIYSQRGDDNDNQDNIVVPTGCESKTQFDIDPCSEIM